METLRTPEARFENLDGYPFSPHYIDVGEDSGSELRLHYVDEGPQDSLVVLLLHGEPSWSYLYRKMIPTIAAAGHRVVAPDLIGFGRSDKPTERSDYSYQTHLTWLNRFLQHLESDNIVLFCQDWGGLLGLRLVAEHPDRFAGVIAANTFLPTGDMEPSEAFLNWQKFSQTVESFPIGGILDGATESELSDAVKAGYDAPFPDESYKAGARQFPMLVPITPDNEESENNRRAWQVLANFKKPFLTAFSDKDPVTAGGDIAMQRTIAGCQGQNHVTIKDAGHFLQEDAGQELAELVNTFIDTNKLNGN